MPALRQVAGVRILIVRGLGGQQSMTRELKRRGALVDHLECYERQAAAVDSEQLRTWVAGSEVDIVTLASSGTAEQFWAGLPADLKSRVANLPLAVLSSAVAQRARGLGLVGPCEIALQATDAGLVEAVCVASQAL